MPTDIDITFEGDVAIFRVNTDLWYRAGSSLRDAVSRLIEKGYKKFVLDISYMKYLQSGDLGVLVSALMTIRKNSGNMVVAASESKFSDVLHLTKLNSVLAIYPTVEDAVKSFAGPPSAFKAASR